jgi:DNA-binding PadR family transcriptional regulator
VKKLSFEDSLQESVEACEVFSNLQRSIIVLIIAVYEEISWTELKIKVEEVSGSINPNTLSFHLKKLVESGIIRKGGTSTQPFYEITSKGEYEIEKKIGKDKKNELRKILNDG